MTRSGFHKVNAKVDFPRLEHDVLDLWDRIDAFAGSISSRPDDRPYVFYDGPPFPTGSPHYGNLLAGVIKDVVPRYWTMRGYRVERRFGWDTHGLPIEMEVERQLGISGPAEIAQFGIAAFNEACRSLVETNTERWETITRRIGRWVDFRDDYKTMDLGFMESVWWVFGQLWDRGLIYEDFKVLPYSWGAATPLSNFEANLDYRDTDDPSITISLEVLTGSGPIAPGDRLLVWTTTPWTLPANLAIAVGAEIEYVRIDEGETRSWVAATLVDAFWRDGAVPAATTTGSELVGIEYAPPFDHFVGEREHGAFRVITAADVTAEEGTGLVHMAPAYGETDFFALQAAGIGALVDPVDEGGRFTDAVPEVAGLNVKDADPVLIGLLKEAGLLVRTERIRHSYPFCYRTGTPLIYKAIPTWFVRVEQIKDRMVAHNDKIHWVPEHVGSRRFGNWLDGARDWAISRNRYWGSCIPVWRCDSCGHTECIGSLDDLESHSGTRPSDLHKHVIDPITWPCPTGDGTMQRVPEVLDCWFESGSMPYGQVHYPFENKERFEATFPAQFIAEGLDQTRGWFYTLHVLGTALFDSPAFRNCVVNGLILAEDGRKMSKSLKNYPDPDVVLEAFGADALRAFLINSPVLRAEPLRFTEEGIRDVVRTVLLPLWNTFSFFTTYAEADGVTLDDLRAAPSPDARPELDRWILSVLQSLIAEVNDQMEGYFLYSVVPPILGFIDDLTNWYVRRSRRRFWRTRTTDDADKLAAFATLYEVLVTFIQVLAPVLPFISERLHQELVVALDPDAPASVHLCAYPMADPDLIDTDLEAAIATVRTVVQLGHAVRKHRQIRVRQPLPAAMVLTHDPATAAAVRLHADLIADELNVKDVIVGADEGDFVELSAKIDFRALGPRLGKAVKDVAAAVERLDSDTIRRLLDGATLTVAGVAITVEDLVVRRAAREGMVVESAGPIAVALDTRIDDDLRVEGLSREVVSRVQQLRRDLGLEVSDWIAVSWHSEDPDIISAFARHGAAIAAEVLAKVLVPEPGMEALLDVEGHPLGLAIHPVDTR